MMRSYDQGRVYNVCNMMINFLHVGKNQLSPIFKAGSQNEKEYPRAKAGG